MKIGKLRRRFCLIGWFIVAGTPSLARETPALKPSSALVCSPTQVRIGERITLTFSLPHAQELAIMRPDGAYFFIAQRRLGGADSSGMPSHLFAGISKLVIGTGIFRAKQWGVGVSESELVFTSPGHYRFLMSDALESEDAGGTASCYVKVS